MKNKNTHILFHLFAIFLIIQLLGCELYYGVIRDVNLQNEIDDECILKSFQSVPESYNVRQEELTNSKAFYWNAKNDDLVSHGIVVIEPISDENWKLKLYTGQMNNYNKNSIEYGKIILDKLYLELKNNCPNMPEPTMVNEKCIRTCD